MEKVTDSIYTFSGLWAGRVFCLEDADGLTLIDTSISLAASRILKQLGARSDQVKRILITHAHPDHVGSLHKLQAITGAEVYTSQPEADVIEGRIAVPRNETMRIRMPETRFTPTPVHHILQDGDIIEPVLGGLQAVSTPGHAPGHLAFFHPERGILFGGDVLFRIASRHPSGLRLPLELFTVDMSENIRSAQRLAALQPKIFCPGHGKPMTENTAQVLGDFVATLKS